MKIRETEQDKFENFLTQDVIEKAIIRMCKTCRNLRKQGFVRESPIILRVQDGPTTSMPSLNSDGTTQIICRNVEDIVTACKRSLNHRKRAQSHASRGGLAQVQDYRDGCSGKSSLSVLSVLIYP